MTSRLKMNFLNITSRRGLSLSNNTLKRLDFFYDVASPYSWFSFEVLMRYKKIWKVDLHLQPVLLGGIFKNTKNVSPLMTSAAKAIHMNVDTKRCATYFRVPLLPMQDITDLFTKGSIPPMRFLTATKLICPQHLEEASRKFWIIRWNKDQDFTTADALKRVVETCGMSEEEGNLVLEKMLSDEIKMALKKNTDYAVDCGVFGVPTIIVHDNEEKNIFFGSDRFPILAQELNEEWRGPCPEKCSKL